MYKENSNYLEMKSIRIDITKKIVRIECDYGHEFIESLEVLETKGIVVCPKCGKDYLLQLKR